jgi:hypothetical protein
MLCIIRCRIFCFQLAIKKFKDEHMQNYLPVVVYVCETWSLTLREDPRLSLYENRVLRRMFGPK